MPRVFPNPTLFLSLLVSLAACRSPAPDPAALLPPGADAWLVVRPLDRVGARLTATLDRVPEGGGVLELIRSLSGIDFRDPAGTRDSGLDPKRGLALARVGQEILIVLPVLDREVADRRLGLRLARLGFVEEEGRAGSRCFSDGRAFASLRVSAGIGRIGFGPGACPDLPDSPPALDPSGDVSAELGMPEADVVARVSNDALGRVLRDAGIPSFAPVSLDAIAFVLPWLGDLRLAASFEGRVSFRAVVGTTGDPLDPPRNPGPPPAGSALWIAVSLPPGLFHGFLPGFFDESCGSGCRDAAGPGEWDRQAAIAIGGFSGTFVLALMASPGSGPAPLSLDARFANRMRIVAVTRFGDPAQALAATNLALAAARAARWKVQPFPDGSGFTTVSPGGIELSSAAGPGPWVTVSGSSSAGAARSLAAGSSSSTTTGLLQPADGAVLGVRIDPNAVLEAVGGGGVEFVRHTLGALRSVHLDLTVSTTRAVLDAGVEPR